MSADSQASPGGGRGLLARERLYAAALTAARPALPLAGRLNAKLARGLSGRRGALQRMEAWAAAGRDPARPLVWVHAPSVGEALMAQAIVGALRERAPALQVVFTHFSPSAERVAARVGADFADYLPWDVPADVARALGALRPSALAWVRTEAWPVLCALAQRQGARLAMVNAVLAPGSSRLRAPSRFLLGPTYRRLDAVGAVGERDLESFGRLGVSPDRVRVTGDARFDQVWARVHRPPPAHPLLDRLRDPDGLTLVAGSTWAPDESRLLSGLARARTSGVRWRLIIAPHEPDEAHLAPLEARLDSLRMPHVRLARLEAGEPPADVVIVDRVGVLADLYALAAVAYVGGGFHGAGLHSVVEPAALGVPVVFGPTHGSSRDAPDLEAAGGGWEVGDAYELESCLLELGGERGEGTRRRAAAAAEAWVRSRLGGAAANAGVVLEQLAAAARG